MPAILVAAALLALAACERPPPPPAPSTEPPRLVAADTVDTSDGGAVALDAAEAARLVASDPLWARALRLHYDALVVDGHVDTPTLMLDRSYDVGERHADDHLDLPRMREGGLDAAFFSIYVARSYGEGQAATDLALAMIDAVQRQLAGRDDAALVRTADGMIEARRRGQTAILLGLEGGHALQASPETLRQLAANGVRYVTLTHSNTNAFADAATDRARWNGLNETGRELVAEMNRLGVLVDLSHVSDSTFFDALAVTRAPVILSHSSARAVHPHVRNASDAMLAALAENGGVAMINLYADYLGPGATVETALDHIAHAVRVAGANHVGLGSDFDGVPRLPTGLDDVTRLPWITHGLLRRGVSDADVRKILGGNVLRVLREAERVAAEIQAEDT
ncbi:dipeptidase [Rubrivirga sp. IMCC45206]|uniref:dipeptidase n=1 Tax=Rubrivirga sp. IMCC45206 TaxID=3391614 RepID=UPI00398F955F